MSAALIPANQLLAALPQKKYAHLFPRFERVALVYGKNVYTPGDAISHVYFPESGIVSLLAVVGEHSTLEVGIVGNEGMIGLPLYLGVKTSRDRAVVQGAGFALRMTADDFLDECESSDALPRILKHFTYSLMTQISQSAACNRFHPIKSRLARWLLMTGDRMNADKFDITQEFLSNMLGVRREAVNKAAMNFQKKRLIDYSRGHLTILNRNAIEVMACNCYKIISGLTL